MGDRRAAVADAAEALGVAEWESGLTPAEKIARIEALKVKGGKVLMVGDGVNDAPALAAAHVSISPVTAAHVSQAAADAVFIGGRLAPILSALATGRKAKRLMAQNLAFSALYNVFAIPLAAAGLLTPLIAALAMSLSSVAVTGTPCGRAFAGPRLRQSPRSGAGAPPAKPAVPALRAA